MGCFAPPHSRLGRTLDSHFLSKRVPILLHGISTYVCVCVFLVDMLQEDEPNRVADHKYGVQETMLWENYRAGSKSYKEEFT